MSADPSLRTGDRIAWLDLARAGSIILVVLYHVGSGAGHALLPAEQTNAGAWWSYLNSLLVPVRMPLFFLVSGMLAGRAVHRAWPLVLRPRVLDLLWPYMLWSGLFAVTAWARYAPDAPLTYILQQVKATGVAMGPYWFIAVLPLFFLTVRLGRHRPRLLLTVGILIYIVSWPLRQLLVGVELVPDLAAQGLYRFTEFAIWYIAGYVLRDRILTFATRARMVVALLGVVGFMAAVLLLYGGDFGILINRILQASATLFGLLTAVALTHRITRIGAVQRLGKALGSRTLAIYLVHPFVVNAVVVLYPGSDLQQALNGSLISDWLLVPAVTALAVAVALLVHAITNRWGPAWLFAAPGTKRIDGGRAGAATGRRDTGNSE